MGKRVSIVIGERVNRLIVLAAAAPDRRGEKRVIVRCDCGTEKSISLCHFRGGAVLSCGCYNSERTAKTNKDRAIHGKTGTTEFRIWEGMKARCLNPNHTFYSHYGGRGITICPHWLDSFEQFYEDMGPRPPGTTLDRKENDGPYSPDNCRWATQTEQMNNTRSNRLLTVGDKTMTLTQWSRQTGVNRTVIASRIKRGWPVERAVAR